MTDSGPRRVSTLPKTSEVVTATPVSCLLPRPCPMHGGPSLATCRNVEPPAEMRQPPFGAVSRRLAGGRPAVGSLCHGFHPDPPRVGRRAMAPLHKVTYTVLRPISPQCTYGENSGNLLRKQTSSFLPSTLWNLFHKSRSSQTNSL